MKLKHYDNLNQARFITFCTHQSMPLITNNKYRQIVIDSIKAAKNKLHFKLIGYVLMPEHVHLVILPDQGTRAGAIIGEIKQVSSKKIHEILDTSKSPLLEKLTVRRNHLMRFTFWQRRCYDHNCRDEESMWEKVNYCHNNPVKRGLVKSPLDWRWSSYRYYNGYDDYMLEMDNIG